VGARPGLQGCTKGLLAPPCTRHTVFIVPKTAGRGALQDGGSGIPAPCPPAVGAVSARLPLKETSEGQQGQGGSQPQGSGVACPPCPRDSQEGLEFFLVQPIPLFSCKKQTLGVGTGLWAAVLHSLHPQLNPNLNHCS
jgi:hypothetical protein